MPNFSVERDLAFLLSDAARLLRTCADQEARRFGMTRAQWAVLFRLQRNEGLKQSELADLLEVQPITLTRLIDRLCENGLIERRSDPSDRRAKRLFLTPAAKPVMERLTCWPRSIRARGGGSIARNSQEQPAPIDPAAGGL
jgi:MarR family transcriptional regulator, transcriptional regulator for hemolysin